jgi:hypothetical protein
LSGLVGHRDLLSRPGLAELETRAGRLEESVRTIVQAYAMEYRQKLIEYVEGCSADPHCAVIDA